MIISEKIKNCIKIVYYLSIPTTAIIGLIIAKKQLDIALKTYVEESEVRQKLFKAEELQTNVKTSLYENYVSRIKKLGQEIDDIDKKLFELNWVETTDARIINETRATAEILRKQQEIKMKEKSDLDKAIWQRLSEER